MLEYTTQVWLIFLMGAAQKAGLLPISKMLLHRIVYLSNCLAPLFETAPTTATIVKYKRGPFYPRLQWYLDRLAALGIIMVQDLRYIQDKHGNWMEANYLVNGATWEIIDTCKQIHYGRQLEDYLTEMVFAIGTTSRRTWDETALYDSIYDAPGKSEGAFIDFSDPENNLSIQTARAFQDVLPKGFIVSPKEEMFLYLRFLESQVGRHMQ